MTAYLVALVALLSSLVGAPLGNMGFNAGPPTLYQVEPEPLVGNSAIVFAIDTSAPSDVLAGIQQSTTSLVQGLAGTEIAITTLGTPPTILQDFTTDTATLTAAINGLSSSDGTALMDGALQSASLAIGAGADNPVVVLVTDGDEGNDLSTATLQDVLVEVAMNGVKMYTIGYGDADPTLLSIFADSNGATYQAASDVNALSNAFASLAPILGASATNIASITPETDTSADTDPNSVLPSGVGSGGDATSTTPNATTDTTLNPLDPLPEANLAPLGQATSNDAVVLVVDMSGSMAAYLTDIKNTLTNFVNEVRGAAPIALVAFETNEYIVSNFSTDTDTLVAAIDGLDLGDQAALYDAMLDAVGLAADSPAEAANTSIILLTDSGDSAPSSSARNEAIDLAVEAGIAVYTFGIGSPDTGYLQEFATATGGEYLLINAGILEREYDALRETLIGDVTIVTDPAIIVDQEGEFEVEGGSIQALDANEEGDSIGDVVGGGAAADFNSNALNPDELNNPTDAISGDTSNTIPNNQTDNVAQDDVAGEPIDPGIILPDNVNQGNAEPVTGLIPVIISVPETLDIASAVLSINDVPIYAFTDVGVDGTLRYNEFDTSLLDTGAYQMGLQVTNVDRVTVSDKIFFNVQVLQTDGSGTLVDENGNDITNTVITDALAPRLITIGGEPRPFILQFDPEEGLSLDNDALAAANPEQGQSLLDILLAPLDFIPEPIKNALTRQYPGATTGIVVLMTIILFPQGVFTVYWMTYTWVSPERVERSSSPKVFMEPKYSIAAMLPARKEGAVIYDTIQSVHGVNYPDELKHIQVLVRNDFPHDADAELNDAPLSDEEKEIKDAEQRAENAEVIAEHQERFRRNNQPWADIEEVLQQPGAELKDDLITLIETLRAIYDIRDMYQVRFALMEIQEAYKADGKAFPIIEIRLDDKPAGQDLFWTSKDDTSNEEMPSEEKAAPVDILLTVGFQQDPVDGRRYQKISWKNHDSDNEAVFEAIKEEVVERKKGYKPFDKRIWVENVELIHFEGGPKNKPNGLNRGLRVSEQDVMTIFDAEDSPHPDIYNIVNTVMIRDKADVVQSGVQLMNFETTWFSSFNCLEYFFWFKSGLHAYTHALKVTPLGGNTCFFKKVWLDKLAAQDEEKGYRAWDEGCLTEDADVGFRLTSMGASIQIVYDAKHATREETPDAVPEFVKQRTRWCQGFYEIFMKFDWARLPTFKQRVVALYILLNSLLQAAVLLFLPIGIYIGLTQRVSLPIALLSWLPIYLLLVQAGITLLGIREFTASYKMKLPLGFRLKMAFYYYPYQLLMAASALRAVYRFLTNNSAWEKTAHSNLHRAGNAQQAVVH